MINSPEVRKLFHDAINKFGISHQSFVAIEEMAELTKELSKEFRYGSNMINITEEIADVEIMLAQLKLYYGIRSDVEYFKSHKIKRLEDIIKNDS